jgi:cytochrome c oxidase assembly factor CtaG/cytochrome c2
MRLNARVPLIVSFLALPASAAAHGNSDVNSFGSPLVTGWSPDGSTLIPLAIATGWYAAGIRRAMLERRTELISPARTIAFAGGIAILFLALQSPIDTISAELFSVHMTQHLLLMLGAPPLLVWSDCPMVFLRALPRPSRKLIAQFWVSRFKWIYDMLMHPLIVWSLFCGAFVFWHSPGPYQWALDRNWVHILEHLSFFVSSLMFWSLVLSPHGQRRRLQHGPTLLLIVSTAVLSGLPGALMIFSPRPLYPGHADGVVKWGLTLLEDQQLAGLIMWIPAGAAYVLAAALVFLRWLDEAEERAIRAARRGVSLFVMVSLAGLLLGGCDKEDNSSIVNFSGDAYRGASLINKYGCGGCHSIPDIANANGNVGPPLQHVGTRTYIAGILNNSPDNMSLWLQNPQKVLPGNAMPAMGISQQDSRDMTAFLYTLK